MRRQLLVWIDNWFDASDAPPETQRRLRVLFLVTGLIVAIGLPFVVQYWLLGIPLLSACVSATIVLGLANLAWARRHKNAERSGAVGTTVLLMLLLASNCVSGGFYDPNFGWLYVIPVLGALMVNARAGWVFTGVVAIVTLLFWLAPESGIVVPNLIPVDEHAKQSLFNRLSAIVAIGVALAAISSQQSFARALLAKANEGLRHEMVRREEIQQRLIQTERMASMGTLAAGVAHEINNPLTYVSTNLALAKREMEASSDGNDAAQSMLTLINEAAEGTERVRLLVRDLKTFGRTAGETVGPVQLSMIADRAIKMSSNEIRHRAELRTKLAPDAWVVGNEGRLLQVIVNLLTNAAHAITEGAADLNYIDVTVSPKGEEVLLEVSDSGDGIAPDDREIIFEPFFTTKPVGFGAGMGLAISRNIVEALGGHLDLLRSDSEGSTFCIALPRAAKPTEEMPVPKTVRASLIPRMRLLIIDDEPAILRALKRTLAEHEVVAVRDAQSALQACSGQTFHLILCDLMMPNITGADFYEALKRQGRGAERQVVFMTGGVFCERTAHFLISYEGVLIEKPIDLDRLQDLLATHAPSDERIASVAP